MASKHQRCTSPPTVFDESQISAIECAKSFCLKCCQSLIVKLFCLMITMYFGGLVWFFWPYSSSWSQLFYLCHQSSSEFFSNDIYPLFISSSHHNHNGIDHLKCDENDILSCEMERQQQEVLWSKTSKNRDYCIKHVHDQNFQILHVPKELVKKNKHKSLHHLLSDIYESNGLKQSISMELNYAEMKREFGKELSLCNAKSSQFLTSFSPVIGFHVLCFEHYPKYSQSLLIAYQHGFKKKNLPSIPFKNRKHCIVRSVAGINDSAENMENILNNTYYVTNECEIRISSKQSNPKYILLHIKSMKELRRHLQNYLISDVASYDQYTIEGVDISKDIITKHNQFVQELNDDEAEFVPTKSPETEKFYQILQEKREDRDKNHHQNAYSQQQHKKQTLEYDASAYGTPYTQSINPHSNEYDISDLIVGKYRKNPFSLYYPSGRTVSYYTNRTELFKMDGDIVFMFEGGRFIWPGVKKGHVITLPIGPNVQLTTLNMRPLVFEITGLITKGEVAYIRNKSEPRMNRSEVGLNEDKKVSESRTCSSAWLFGGQDIMVNSLKNRCQRILQIPKDHMEDMEVIRYKKGEKFSMHYDAFQSYDAASSQSQVLLHGGFKNRIATILYYLSDVDAESGGYTVFPRHDDNIEFDENGIEKYGLDHRKLQEKACKKNESFGLRITPESGKTILFYNMLPNGDVDPAALQFCSFCFFAYYVYTLFIQWWM